MSFRIRLLLGAAAPFVLAAPALAQVTISTATTAPVATSTAGTGSTAADVIITNTGSVTLTGAAGATAVTIDSPNTVTNGGTISVVNSDNATGVRITNGAAGVGYTATGAITILEDYTRTDTDNDGDLDGPLAQGTGRIGLLVDAGATFNGSIGLNAGSVVNVEGNNSHGVSIRSVLGRNYIQRGALTIVGSNNVGLDIREDVTGNIAIGGSTMAQGENSVGVRVLGDVAGEFMVDGAIQATGFTSTSISNYADPDLLGPNDTPIADRRDADDLLVGGPALEIRGDLARGFLINGLAVGGVDPTPDVKDVVQNFNENRSQGSVTSFGSAPAVLIQSLDGAAGAELRLARVRESVPDNLDDDDDDNLDEIIGVFNYDFGFMNRGSVLANGLNIGFNATGVRIAGSADGMHQTIVEGGIFNGGSIGAAGFEGNATALNIGSGASSPQLVNSGSIQASVATETNHDSAGVRIDAGASLPTVVNSGLILANTRGYDGDAVAFQDLSGTVTSVTNSSRIVAGYTDDDTSDTVTSGLGRAIALDLSHSASGVTLTQLDTPDNARITGDILFGVGDDRFDLLSGEVTGDVEFGAGSDTLMINSAKLFGNATFLGANATISMIGGEMAGDLSLGAAAGALSFTDGSIYNGGITGTGAINMTVDNATVNNSAGGTLSLASMDLSNNAKIGFVINNARIAANTPIFNIAGVANVGANTVFTPIFEEFSNQTFTLRVLDAATLNLGGPLSAMLNANSPYIYDIQLVQPAGQNALDLMLRVKTETELGLNGRQASAYDAVLDLMATDSTVGSAVTALPGANEFLRGWNDLLPAQDAAIMKVLASNATAAFGAAAHRLDLISDKPDAPGGAWAEEFGVYHDSDATADGLGVTGGGFGVATGIDVISTGEMLFGAFASIESLELEESDRTGAPLNVSQTMFGGYAGWKNGNLALNAAAGFGLVDFSSDRKVEFGGISDRVRADWSGTTYNAGARATYSMPMGFLELRPFIAADYMGFQQDGYQETAEALDELAIIAEDSEATLATASYGAALIGNFGSDDAYSVRPQLSVGYRSVLTWDNTTAPMRFVGGSPGATFNLLPGTEAEDALVAGLGLNIDSQFLNIHVGYDAEVSDTSTTHYGSITLRMAFW